MKKNIIIFIAICLTIMGYYVFDFFSYDGEIELKAEIEISQIIKAYITGEVINPGVYELIEGSRLEDFVDVAGGFTENANITHINLAMIIYDGDKIIIPIFSTESENSVRDLNTMTKEDLMLIDSIGEITAQKIINYRDQKGYLSLEDLIEIDGIGEQKLEIIRRYLANL